MASRKDSEDGVLTANQNECDREKCSMETISQKDEDLNQHRRNTVFEINQDDISRSYNTSNIEGKTNPVLPTLKSIETQDGVTQHSILPASEETFYIDFHGGVKQM